MGGSQGFLVGPDLARDGGLEALERDTEEWDRVRKLIEERSSRYHQKYRRSELEIERLWKVHPVKPVVEAREKAVESFGDNSQELFHGTSVSIAEKICKSGFKLPETPGMFGKGLYFARCPLKSIQYTKKDAGWFFSMRKRWLDSSGPTMDSMLLCDVFLGRMRVERNSCNVSSYSEISSPQELGPTCVDAVCCPWVFLDRYCLCRGYDSLYAPGGPFWWNTVRVSEFVVYDAIQAIPTYVIEFRVKKKRRDGGRQAGSAMVGEPVAVDEATEMQEPESLPPEHSPKPQHSRRSHRENRGTRRGRPDGKADRDRSGSARASALLQS